MDLLMKKIDIECTNNNKTKTVDVLSENDKYLKVAIEDTQITIELFRHDVNKPYIGHTAGLEFTWQPKN
jgi:hypothetical protein